MSNLSQFQPPGYVAWQAKKTASFTAEASKGYPVDTSGGGITATLPAAATLGDTIEFNDYARTWQTNNFVININGLKFQSGQVNPNIATEGANLTIVYIDATIGWQVQQNEATANLSVIPAGNQEYTSHGSYTWTVPAGITEVCVVCVGGGGDSGTANSGQAGGGGALAYKNAITVVPGQTAAVTVGRGGVHSGNQGQAGNLSKFAYGGTDYAIAGGGGGGYGEGSGTGGQGGVEGTRSGSYDGGGDGGKGGQDQANHGGPGGGGAGGYSGNGGEGANAPNQSPTNGEGGGGGGAGGGGKGGQSEHGGGGGGGVGIYGQGGNGGGGQGQGQNSTGGGYGGGGSGGNNGSQGQALHGGSGGNYGGGHGGSQSEGTSGSPGNGAVRIIWGTGRNFPNNASLV